jgi:superfamily II DNA/RNA helicase
MNINAFQSRDFFYNPVQISVGQVSQSATANMDITQRIMVSDKYDKMPKLLALLPSLAKQGSGLIFVQLKKNTDWLEKELSRYGYPGNII